MQRLTAYSPARDTTWHDCVMCPGFQAGQRRVRSALRVSRCSVLVLCPWWIQLYHDVMTGHGGRVACKCLHDTRRRAGMHTYASWLYHFVWYRLKAFNMDTLSHRNKSHVHAPCMCCCRCKGLPSPPATWSAPRACQCSDSLFHLSDVFRKPSVCNHNNSVLVVSFAAGRRTLQAFVWLDLR